MHKSKREGPLRPKSAAWPAAFPSAPSASISDTTQGMGRVELRVEDEHGREVVNNQVRRWALDVRGSDENQNVTHRGNLQQSGGKPNKDPSSYLFGDTHHRGRVSSSIPTGHQAEPLDPTLQSLVASGLLTQAIAGSLPQSQDGTPSGNAKDRHGGKRKQKKGRARAGSTPDLRQAVSSSGSSASGSGMSSQWVRVAAMWQAHILGLSVQTPHGPLAAVMERQTSAPTMLGANLQAISHSGVAAIRPSLDDHAVQRRSHNGHSSAESRCHSWHAFQQQVAEVGGGLPHHERRALYHALLNQTHNLLNTDGNSLQQFASPGNVTFPVPPPWCSTPAAWAKAYADHVRERSEFRRLANLTQEKHRMELEKTRQQHRQQMQRQQRSQQQQQRAQQNKLRSKGSAISLTSSGGSSSSTTSSLESSLAASAGSSAFARALTLVRTTKLVKLSKKDLHVRTNPLGRGSFGVSFGGVAHGYVPVVVTMAGPKLSTASVCQNQQQIRASIECLEKLADIEHPNILRILGYTQPNSKCLGIVSEFASGFSLWDQLHGVSTSGAAIRSEDKLSIALQVTSALSFLHTKLYMCHGDVKSQNVFVSDTVPGQPIQAKLGHMRSVPCASLAEASPSKSCVSMLSCNTYLAPEATGELEYVEASDPRWRPCDVYAAGVLLWELCEEAEPFFGLDASAIRRVVRAGRRPPFSPATTSDWRSIIQAAWTQNPGERPSASDLHEQLSRHFATSTWTTVQ